MEHKPIQWIAIYDDGSELSQYNEDGSENLFGDIDQDRLIRFKLESYNKCLSVDLIEGTFRIGTEDIRFDGFDGADYRLIFFRRTRQDFGKSVKTTITPHIGWQTNINGKNYQRIMAISEEGQILFKIK